MTTLDLRGLLCPLTWARTKYALSKLPKGAELRILPADMTLTGPHGSQRLVVVAEKNSQATADLTHQARFTSSNPAVAAVSRR